MCLKTWSATARLTENTFLAWYRTCLKSADQSPHLKAGIWLTVRICLHGWQVHSRTVENLVCDSGNEQETVLRDGVTVQAVTTGEWCICQLQTHSGRGSHCNENCEHKKVAARHGCRIAP